MLAISVPRNPHLVGFEAKRELGEPETVKPGLPPQL